MKRRSGLGWVLFVLFIVVPLAELFVLIKVGSVIGALWTIVALIAISAAGSWLIKREGIRSVSRIRSQLQSFQLPADDVIDGGLILFAGALMLTPGFLTDLLALSLLIPPFRAVVRRVLKRRFGGKLTMLSSMGPSTLRTGDTWTMPDGVHERGVHEN